MMNQKGITKRTGAFAGLLAASMFFTMGSIAWADSEMGVHHDMDGYNHGMGHGMVGGMHGMEPHNAAERFLQMSKSLKLTDNQIKRLTQLRDDYIDKNAKTEEQLNASHGDVARTLMGDDINVKESDNLIDKVGKMESQLWHSYVQQMHDIKAILTTEQKQALKDMWKKPHQRMGEMHEDMSKHPDDMLMDSSDINKEFFYRM